MNRPESRSTDEVAAHFGVDVFDSASMRRYLSPRVHAAVEATRREGRPFDAGDHDLAEEVACAMKIWAMERGATHFSHWFQPLTGNTAEKHESFLSEAVDGAAVAAFSGKDLRRGESDASSFPSGGLRATFEARGYTAWDPTSHAFVANAGTPRAVLCIPCVFCGHHGEALDEKTPLLRSQAALEKQLRRVAGLFEVPGDARPHAALGAEQEYFLVDRKFYERRPDLLLCGRTLFGRRPARHRRTEDHYFGSIKPRVLEFMADVDRKLWRLGVPARTRHNEASPGQFELAPVFEEQNVAVDHNMLIMQVLRETAEARGLACLLHEKPFSGVNGSGKHNNWSIIGNDGKNWFAPGATPHENAKFLFMLVAVIKAIDTHAALIRATVATAGNDQRLGAHEAPPAILSIYLGDQMNDIIDQIEAGGAMASKAGGHIEIGVSALPRLPRDESDRNRTSPFAFTGDKFEFRAVGASQSCAPPNAILNLALAAALDEMIGDLERLLPESRPARARGTHTAVFHDALQTVLRREVKAHRRVLFSGDGYSTEWREEAARRGLPNLATASAALEHLVSPESLALGERYGVLSVREARSRHQVRRHDWEQRRRVEAECALNLSRTLILPAVLTWERELALIAREAEAMGRSGERRIHYGEYAAWAEKLFAAIEALEARLAGDPDDLAGLMAQLRQPVDALEALTPEERWPLPSYRDMFFKL